jgi:hypothetical protein
MVRPVFCGGTTSNAVMGGVAVSIAIDASVAEPAATKPANVADLPLLAFALCLFSRAPYIGVVRS